MENHVLAEDIAAGIIVVVRVGDYDTIFKWIQKEILLTIITPKSDYALNTHAEIRF